MAGRIVREVVVAKRDNRAPWRIATLVACGLYMLYSPAAQAGYYLYQLPDGSRMISDRPIANKRYKLVRKSTDLEKMGRQAAGRYQKRNLDTREQYERLIARTADLYGVEVALVKAVIHAESHFNPQATSLKGATGLMQLMPATAERYGVSDLYDPHQNLKAGVQHLRYLLGRYGNNLHAAVAAYNAGETAVEQHKGIPPYAETRRYVEKVLAYRDYYNSWP